MFTFTPLQGAQSASRASQSILELDGGVKILVDVGWDAKFDTRMLAELEKHVPTLSFILLTHATISHLGAFAHCCKHVPLFTQIPVYATNPVIAFGRTLMQDLYSSTVLAATFIPATTTAEDEEEPSFTREGIQEGGKEREEKAGLGTKLNILREAPTFEEINKYFSSITPLKYSQPLQPTASYFSAPLEGLTLTAYNAGHTLGGTIWHVQHGMESIVYAVDWQQARENVVAGAAWFGVVGGKDVIEQLRKPTALVCSSVNGDRIGLSGGRRTRDEHLLGHIRSSLMKGGTALIPTDSSARILELAWLLEKTWQDLATDDTLKSAKVYMVSRAAHATLRHARSLLEWMDDSIVRGFDGEDEDTAKTHRRTGSKQANNANLKPSRPFDFQHVRIVERKAQLERIFKTSGPCVILASDLSLEWGYSKLIFEQVAQKPENLIIMTERCRRNGPSKGLSLQTLWQWYDERLDGVAPEKSTAGDQIEQIHTGGRMITVRSAQKVPLEGFESQRYQQYMAAQKQIQDSLVTADGRQAGDAEDALDEDNESSSESDDSEDEQQGRALNVSTALTHGSRNRVALTDEELGVSILVRKRDVHDFDVRNKRGRNAVFPYTHSRRRGDEFGDFIKPEEFLREEEKEAQESQDDEKQAAILGQKRKWHEANKSKLDHPSKRHESRPGREGREGRLETNGDADSSDESEDEEVDGQPVELEGARGPGKAVFSEAQIPVSARLAFVDFAGLHDQRSLQLVIPLVDPKKLILIGGSSSETKALAGDCKELLGMKVAGTESDTTAEIFSPAVGQTVDASVDTNAWVVKLSRDLAKRLQWQHIKNIGIVTITGQLRAEVLGENSKSQDTAVAKKPKLEEKVQSEVGDNASHQDSLEPILDTVPANLAASTRSVVQPIHVGDLRLAELRRLMNKAGHAAEFRGEGTLLVDGMIAVRKLASGRIVVEGAPVSNQPPNRMDSFTQVKRRIYEGLAVVATGFRTKSCVQLLQLVAESQSTEQAIRDSSGVEATMAYYGKVREHYYTPDGGVPSQGKVPGPPQKYYTQDGAVPYQGKVPSQNPQSSTPIFLVSNARPVLLAPGPQPATSRPSGPLPVNRGWYQVHSPVDQSTAQTSTNPTFTTASQPTATAVSWAAAQCKPAGGRQPNGLQPPMSGNRSGGQLATFPSRKFGYLFSKKQAMVHVFNENWIDPQCTLEEGEEIPFPSGPILSGFTAQQVACSTTIEEFIDLIDCKERAVKAGAPADAPVGFVELHRSRKDKGFIVGAKVFSGTANAEFEIGQLWRAGTGSTTGPETPWVVRLPV